MNSSSVSISPIDYDWELARSVREDFANRPGSQHIATEFALTYLSALVRQERPQRVLEFGAGIGTITSLLLRHESAIPHLVSTEEDPFCIAELNNNIPAPLMTRWELITEIHKLDINQFYDLVIVDAGLERSCYSVFRLGTLCFIEGSRKSTRNTLSERLQQRGLECHLVNYRRGVRLFHAYLSRSKHFKIPYPKIKFRKILKGCWIARVTNASTDPR